MSNSARLLAQALALVVGVAAAGMPATARVDRSSGSAPELRSRQAFDRLARVAHTGRGTPMPHVMFAIDRADHDRVYYIDSKRFRFHKDFVNATYLSLERGSAFYTRNYSNPNRRFLFGTLAYQVPLARFTFEFFEGDRVTPDLVALAARRLSETFYGPVAFKASSDAQVEAGRAVPGLDVVRASELYAGEVYTPLNTGSATGVLRILDRVTPETVLDRNEILILREVPVTLTPVSGIVSTTQPAPLAHVNVLARSWSIPNIYARGADETYAGLNGKYVRLDARADGYEIRLATPEELVATQRRNIAIREQRTPKADLAYSELTSLRQQRAKDSLRFGAKSANLGHVMALGIPDVTVPDGFTIPFSYYARFASATGIEDEIYDMLDDERFNHDVVYRRERLAAMRRRIEGSEVPADLARSIVERAKREFGDAGLFVRSSTNAEDLPGFSGAGLYTTVPNVKGEAELLRAVKTVWASIWNDAAYEARQEAGMGHLVYPAVLVQLGMNADAAGVLVTTNPFNRSDRGAVYINAKRGLGIRVVDGHKVPEQIIYHPATNRVRVITRSADDTALAFAPDGGVREVRIETGRAVLSDALVRRLARAAARIERGMRMGPLDIEWLTIGDRIYIVQARPFQE